MCACVCAAADTDECGRWQTLVIFSIGSSIRAARDLAQRLLPGVAVTVVEDHGSLAANAGMGPSLEHTQVSQMLVLAFDSVGAPGAIVVDPMDTNRRPSPDALLFLRWAHRTTLDWPVVDRGATLAVYVPQGCSVPPRPGITHSLTH